MSIGKILIFLGFSLLIIGLFVQIIESSKMNWFGKTIFDFYYEGKNIKFFAPIGSTLILSIFLSIIINLIIKFFK